jgi:DNA-binding transcriptional LysR family regulator
MDLRDIKAFVALAETGSINRTALRLNLTQPATTRRVQNFEAAIGGAALLDRSAKPAVLTPVGRQVLAHCRRVLAAVSELEASASGTQEPEGDLRIGIAHGHADVVLSSPLDNLRRRYPSVLLRVSADWTSRLIEDVHSTALDCAVGLLTKDHMAPAGMHAAPLGQENIVIVAARNSCPRRKDRGPLGLQDLVDHVWILNPAGCGCRAALQRAFDRISAPMGIATEVFGEELQLSLIARGSGLGLVPQRQLDSSPHRRQLRIVKTTDFDLQATVTMLHGSSLGRLAAAVDYLQDTISAKLRYHR